MQLSLFLLLGACSSAWAAPLVDSRDAAPVEFSLPFEDSNPEARRAEIEQTREGLLYGPSLLGNTSFYPSGPLGDALSVQDQTLWAGGGQEQTARALRDAAKALDNIKANGGITKLQDFKLLYDGQWLESVPQGIAEGQLQNFQSDLLFAMERLSVNPYVIRRLHPTEDEVPFAVDAEAVSSITGSTVAALHAGGRLLVADHSYQKNYTLLPGRYAAACTALFFLDARHGNALLPLAIKTNVGADLTYTPLDGGWLLAKAMFSANDLFHGQIFHLAHTHAVAEIVYLAALRTMSARHPLLALLRRLMYQAYALRPVGERVLFNQGGLYEQSFPYPREMVFRFEEQFYRTRAGRWRAGYLDADLRARGLLGADPPLARFPFHEDAARVVAALRGFTGALVDGVYGAGGDAAVARDAELQAWVAEAGGAAGVVDFVAGPVGARADVADLLAHLAWLTGGAHHVLNQGAPVAAAGVLPLHPAALYAAPPASAADGAGDALLGWLPPPDKAVEQVALLARFNRPDVPLRNETLRNMFATEDLRAAAGDVYDAANACFQAEMDALSAEVAARRLGPDGLSQGMPFVWKALDPAVVPFYLSV